MASHIPGSHVPLHLEDGYIKSGLQREPHENDRLGAVPPGGVPGPVSSRCWRGALAVLAARLGFVRTSLVSITGFTNRGILLKGSKDRDGS